MDCARRARRSPTTPRHAGDGRRGWRRPISTTDMVREFTELQGTMGGIYAREEGLPEAGLEGDLLPLPADRRRSRRAADARAARRGGGHLGGGVARRQARHDRRPVRGRREADRLARSVRPAPRSAGRREDPGGSAGARRASIARSACAAARAAAAHAPDSTAAGRRRAQAASSRSCASASRFVLEQRGFAGESRARRRSPRPATSVRCARGAWPRRCRRCAASADFQALAVLFKRVKNIAQGASRSATRRARSRAR